ncbi:MAG: glycyl-radical enzyme activating protein [Clostridia bacterium]|nr:glycyl-radical enzyme activating protein [Clostridia bacterium]
MCNGKIFNIQRFCTNDGPGIRTTVFLKGCPLNCVWCHNPESRRRQSELLFSPEKCINCTACGAVCKNHDFETGTHKMMGNKCYACGKCSSVCPTEALEVCGKSVSTDEVLETVLKDLEFYKASGGGATLSGGEPLLQSEFSLSLLKKFKAHGLHTAMETCGYYNGDLSEFLPYVDLWLFDMKIYDRDLHKKFTGVSNEVILKNLRFLNENGAKIILRCPIIPDINFNENHFRDISALADSLDNVSEIHLLPYHPLGISKSARMGVLPEYTNESFLSADKLTPYLSFINKTVKIG